MFSRNILLAILGSMAVGSDAFMQSPGAALQLRGAKSVCLAGSRVAVAARPTGAGPVMMAGKLAEKFGHLRGSDVEPCDKAAERFYAFYGKPVPFVFRGATNEILYLSHLDLVNARFQYDEIWATGIFSVFDVFFQALDADTRELLYTSLMKALKLDPSKIKSDAEMVLAWAQGKSEAEVVAAMNGEDSSPVGQIFAKAKNGDEDDFLYTRNFGAGLIKVMQLVNVEPNSANAKKWGEALNFGSSTSEMTGISMSKFEGDVGIFLSSVEKMQQVMQLFADVEAREKKKVAERLAAKADKAAKEAA
jgi:photosystem II biogenesis protein Psp29